MRKSNKNTFTRNEVYNILKKFVVDVVDGGDFDRGIDSSMWSLKKWLDKNSFSDLKEKLEFELDTCIRCKGTRHIECPACVESEKKGELTRKQALNCAGCKGFKYVTCGICGGSGKNKIIK